MRRYVAATLGTRVCSRVPRRSLAELVASGASAGSATGLSEAHLRPSHSIGPAIITYTDRLSMRRAERTAFRP
jgi:hypothetical protein